MEKKSQLPIPLFDQLICSQELLLLKVLLPYVPASMQNIMALYIKMTELQNTRNYFLRFNKNEQLLHPISFSEMLDLLTPYLGFDENMLDSIQSLLEMLSMMKEMDMEDLFEEKGGALFAAMEKSSHIQKSRSNEAGTDSGSSSSSSK